MSEKQTSASLDAEQERRIAALEEQIEELKATVNLLLTLKRDRGTK